MPILTDNYHDFRRGWVHVKAEELSPEALLTALKAGAFYSSTGPEIYDIDLHPRTNASPSTARPLNASF